MWDLSVLSEYFMLALVNLRIYTECRSNRWPKVCSNCHKIISSILLNYDHFLYLDYGFYTMGATSGEWTAYTSGAPEFTLGFWMTFVLLLFTCLCSMFVNCVCQCSLSSFYNGFVFSIDLWLFTSWYLLTLLTCHYKNKNLKYEVELCVICTVHYMEIYSAGFRTNEALC